MVRRVFYINIIVYYLPLIYQLFNTQNPNRFYDMFFLMATAMVVTQFAFNFYEWLYPLIFFRPTLN